MKIRQVNVYVVDTGSYQLVMAESITDEGITGIGEAAVGYGIGSAAAAAMIKELAEIHLILRISGTIFIIIHFGERQEARYFTRLSAPWR